MGEIGLNRVDVRDIAEAAVHVLLVDTFNGKTYPLVSTDVITGEQAADLYSKYLGKSITYIGDDLDGWAEQQLQFLPERIVDDLRAMYNHFIENGYIATEADIKYTRIILGKEPRSYQEFVKELTAQRRKQDLIIVPSKNS